MCGHGTIGVVTALIETGMVRAEEPTTVVRLDTPGGLVTASATVSQGHVTSVSLASVPSYCSRLDQDLLVDDWGKIRYSLAFGGNFYAIVNLDDLGLEFDRSNKDRMVAAGIAIMDALNAQDPPRHPNVAGIDGCHHVYLAASEPDGAHSRHAMCVRPGFIARDPCGTGTAARMSELHARGLLGLHTDFVNESIMGRHFLGRLDAETSVGGQPGVLPVITGKAWVSGTAQWMLDPTDPFPDGFSF